MKTRDKIMNRISIGYIRNSRITQENSIFTQESLIKEFCDRNEIELSEIIIDEGISGSGEKVNDRKGYQTIIKMIENGLVDNLIVISISRWGRNLGDIYRSVELMEKKNTKFYSIKENIDTSSIYGKFTLNLLSSLYEMELGLIRERTRDTLKVKKENNKVYTKFVYGFDRVEGTDDLIKNEKENKMIRKMLRLKDSGRSYGEIVNYLNRNKYRNKSGNKFTRGNIYGILNRRINENYSYVG
jgi:DNA invertase Pin-like site-specific DNA recombinase